MTIKKQFEDAFRENITRDGANKLFDYLASTDFFTAPASTKFHSNHSGGLAEHSLKTYTRFCKMLKLEHGEKWFDDPAHRETAAIIALLHDVCKINCYKIETRNVKVGGEWVQKPYYGFDDPLPYGHGEKSVYIISDYIKLTREEAFAINWHMGGFDARNLDGKFTVATAFTMFPIAVLFHAADLLTTYLDEKAAK
ncbi:MAG: HD domain-containing protein [Christensenellaceae bacterium]|jgi:hypothetical protein|nr:HD domain-containing protein [Christensenellaceae bacterium]